MATTYNVVVCIFVILYSYIVLVLIIMHTVCYALKMNEVVCIMSVAVGVGVSMVIFVKCYV